MRVRRFNWLVYKVLFATGLWLLVAGIAWQEGSVAQAQQDELPLQELRLFSDIYARIKDDYVDEVEDKQLIEGAINGMLDTLDPYSVYMSRREYKDLKIGTTGKFGGLGIEVSMEDGLVKVIAPIEDTPAAAAGLVSGDLIGQIDDTPVRGMTLSDAVEKMRGLVGTKVKLIIIRDDEMPFEVELTRAVIKVKSVKTTLLDDEFGYLRITKFQVKTAELLKQQLQKLKQETALSNQETRLKGIILDLRNNPGGMLNAAVEVTDVFLEPQQLVVSTKGRRDDSAAEYLTRSANESGDIPMVVLLNRGSASASEIVAGALQDHGRAKIIGTQSFGKGSVQTVHPLNKKRALKLTTAKYYTPSERSIHEVGITPDIVLSNPPVASTVSETTDPDKNTSRVRDLKAQLKQDFQVQRALKELRTIVKTAKKT